MHADNNVFAFIAPVKRQHLGMNVSRTFFHQPSQKLLRNSTHCVFMYPCLLCTMLPYLLMHHARHMHTRRSDWLPRNLFHKFSVSTSPSYSCHPGRHRHVCLRRKGVSYVACTMSLVGVFLTSPRLWVATALRSIALSRKSSFFLSTPLSQNFEGRLGPQRGFATNNPYTCSECRCPGW